MLTLKNWIFIFPTLIIFPALAIFCAQDLKMEKLIDKSANKTFYNASLPEGKLKIVCKLLCVSSTLSN